MGFVNRALGAILALLLAVVGAIVLFEIGAVVVGSRPLLARHDRWLDTLSTQAWGERRTGLASVALIAAGVVLLALQLVRQRPAEVAAAGGGPLPARVRRPELEREVAADLRRVQGITTSKVKLRRRGVDVSATVIAGDPHALRDQLAAATRDALAARGVDAGGPVKVDVRRQTAKDS